MRSDVLCAVVLITGTLVSAQRPQQSASANARPAFEVASIKRTPPGTKGFSYGARPGGLWTMTNRTIGTIIREAYPTQINELVGAPGWVSEDPYDVTAKAEGNPSREQMRLMLQALLADRFKLKAHYEKQERPIYALVIARSDGRVAPGLVQSTIDCAAVAAARREGRTPDGPVPANGAPPCAWTGNGEMIRFGGLPLSRLGESIGQPDGRPVVDKTGLPGSYEFTLRYAQQPAPGNDLPSIFTALEEQLGLKLVPERAPLDVLVVDHIERPTEN